MDEANDFQETIDRTNKTITEIDELIAATEAKLQESDELYRSLGIEREELPALMESPKLSPAAREKIKKEVEDWKQEVEEDVQRAVSQAQPSPSAKGGESPKDWMIRV